MVDQLNSISGDLGYLLPELLLIAGILLLVVIDLIWSPNDYILAIIASIAVILALLTIQTNQTEGDSISLFSKMLQLDGTANLWKVILSAAALVTVWLSTVRTVKRFPAEYYVLLLGVLLGSNMLVMSSNLLMMYFSIEVISICSYILTYFSFSKEGAEASIKYLLFGAVASAIMLYGLSLVFALTGTLEFQSQLFVDSLLSAPLLPLVLASLLVLVGVLFKLALVPIHIWSPDVYTAAPTPVVAFFSIVPKLAAFSFLMKLVLVFNLFGQFPVDWRTLLAVLAMAAMLVGNFSALWQTNVKRLLAYSSIAHSGFMLAGIAALTEGGFFAVVFYGVVYGLMNLGVFALVNYFERVRGTTELEGYKGLAKVYPFYTLLIIVLLIALTGLPPTGGFTAKLILFSSIWEAYQLMNNDWLLYLLIFGLLNTVVSLFYYLKIPYLMIFKERDEAVDSGQIKFGLENFLAALMVVAVLLIFINPDWLMGWINNTNFAF